MLRFQPICNVCFSAPKGPLLTAYTNHYITLIAYCCNSTMSHLNCVYNLKEHTPSLLMLWLYEICIIIIGVKIHSFHTNNNVLPCWNLSYNGLHIDMSPAAGVFCSQLQSAKQKGPSQGEDSQRRPEREMWNGGETRSCGTMPAEEPLSCPGLPLMKNLLLTKPSKIKKTERSHSNNHGVKVSMRITAYLGDVS